VPGRDLVQRRESRVAWIVSIRPPVVLSVDHHGEYDCGNENHRYRFLHVCPQLNAPSLEGVSENGWIRRTPSLAKASQESKKLRVDRIEPHLQKPRIRQTLSQDFLVLS